MPRARHSVANGLRDVRTNGVIQCEHCQAMIGVGVPGLRGGLNDRYLRKHQERCRDETDEARAFYLEHGKWPKSEGKARR